MFASFGRSAPFTLLGPFFFYLFFQLIFFPFLSFLVSLNVNWKEVLPVRLILQKLLQKNRRDDRGDADRVSVNQSSAKPYYRGRNLT